jgi:hypothetical protein
MARQFSMPYQIPPVVMLPIAADAAGRTSGYFDLKNSVGKAYVVAEVNQGNAAPVLVSLLQATTLAGAGAKAINAVPIWLTANTALTDALVQQTSAATFTTSAAINDKLVVFELTMESALDMVNGFKFIGVSTGASNAANITGAKLFILQAIQGASAPSAMV